MIQILLIYILDLGLNRTFFPIKNMKDINQLLAKILKELNLNIPKRNFLLTVYWSQQKKLHFQLLCP